MASVDCRQERQSQPVEDLSSPGEGRLSIQVADLAFQPEEVQHQVSAAGFCSYLLAGHQAFQV